MVRCTQNASWIAAALLALTAACGSGRPDAMSKFGAGGIRYQDPAELDSENGLVSVSLNDACVGIDLFTAPAGSTTTTSTDPLTGITYTTTTWTDAVTGVSYSQVSWTDPVTLVTTITTTSTDPVTGATTTTTATTSALTDPTLGNVNTTCAINGNGMPPNLLGINGLRPNSLTDDHFKKWFASDPKTANSLMKYLVKCSLPLGLGMDFDYGGVHYFWPGVLGLASHWAKGEAIPEVEQQLVSACLALHSNRYGAHVPISVLGQYADGTPIPVSGDELSEFPITEGCFFGNVFSKDGVFSGNDRPQALTADESSLRACAMPDRTGSGQSSMCAPIKYAGNCRDLCQPDPTNLYYLTCKVNGRSYRALASRIQPNVEYTCGDGICQVTEKCGTGSTWDNCGLDCGPCN